MLPDQQLQVGRSWWSGVLPYAAERRRGSSAWVEGGTAVDRVADLGRPEQSDQVAGEEDEDELD
eukprot:6093438-Alexandrium_andersonii.AAC.1